MNKIENLKFTDKSQITFDYQHIKENMFRIYLELTVKVHNYLINLCHKTFFQADIKHGYFSVMLHSENWHVFTFTISGIEQLQPTRMSQRSRSAGFIISELMNITLRSISEFSPKPSLMHSELNKPTLIIFYMNNLFSGHSDFET